MTKTHEIKPAESTIPTHDGSALVADTPPPPKRKARRSMQVYDTVESAAAKLGLDPDALRARLRRSQRSEGGSIVADLGGGIHAFKLGRSWRIRFPEG
jgi:hypothetical protein